jgi:hypothetical protein
MLDLDASPQEGMSTKFCVHLSPFGVATGLHGQVNPLASSETTVLKTRFGPGDAGDPLSRSIALDRTWTERNWEQLGNNWAQIEAEITWQSGCKGKTNQQDRNPQLVCGTSHFSSALHRRSRFAYFSAPFARVLLSEHSGCKTKQELLSFDPLADLNLIWRRCWSARRVSNSWKPIIRLRSKGGSPNRGAPSTPATETI